MINKKRHFIVMIAILCLSILILTSGIISIAVFTKSTRTKRVLAPYGDDGMLFSSNYLGEKIENQINKRLLYASSDDQGVQIGVTVCNYAQKNHAKVYETPISYQLTAKLVMVNGSTVTVINDASAYAQALTGKTVTVSFGNSESTTLSSSNLSYTFTTHTLSNESAASDYYTLSFSAGFNNDNSGISLYLEADPGTSYPNVRALDGVFNAKVGTDEAQINWRGYFSDQGALGVTQSTPIVYDGYNYTIEGTGVGSVKFSWNTTKLNPNTLFIIDETVQSETIGGVTWNYIEFEVNSDTINRYDIQLYKADGADFSSASWNDLRSYVSLTFTESLGS